MSIYTDKPVEIFNVWGANPDDLEADTSGQDVFSMIPHFFYEFNGDPTVKVIYAGVSPGINGQQFLTIPIKTLTEYLIKITEPDTKLCFDNLFEGNVTPMIHAIYNAIKNTSIKPNQIYYFSAALDCTDALNTYCQEHNITEKINMYGCNTWEYILNKNSRGIQEVEYFVRPKEKSFLSFNRILRPHRLALLSLLLEKDLVKNAYYSFFPRASHEGKDPLNWNLHLLKEKLSPAVFKRVLIQFQRNEKTFPLKLNIDPSLNKNYIDDDDINLFETSYFSLVTETYFFTSNHRISIDEETVFFSEKIYKPIRMKHPFILVSRPNSLTYLKKLGFKTFSPFINEEYDSIEDNEERMMAIIAEVARLSSLSERQWIGWQNNIKEIVEHNHTILINRKKHEYVYERPNT